MWWIGERDKGNQESAEWRDGDSESRRVDGNAGSLGERQDHPAHRTGRKAGRKTLRQHNLQRKPRLPVHEEEDRVRVARRRRLPAPHGARDAHLRGTAEAAQYPHTGREGGSRGEGDIGAWTHAVSEQPRRRENGKVQGNLRRGEEAGEYRARDVGEPESVAAG